MAGGVQARRGLSGAIREGGSLRLHALAQTARPRSLTQVTIILSGIQAPALRRLEDGTEEAAPFAREARYFVESRLLHRDVQVRCHEVGFDASCPRSRVVWFLAVAVGFSSPGEPGLDAAAMLCLSAGKA